MIENKFNCNNGCHKWSHETGEAPFVCEKCGLEAEDIEERLMDAEKECFKLCKKIVELKKANEGLRYCNELIIKEREAAIFNAGKLIIEMDAEQAHNAVLIKRLEVIEDLLLSYIDEPNNEIKKVIDSALLQTPSDSAAKVQGLVDALEKTRDYMDSCMDAETGYNEAMSAARKALAEWRGEDETGKHA